MFLKSDDYDDIKRRVEGCDGLDHIEHLQKHDIYIAAFKIVDVYFNGYEFWSILSIKYIYLSCVNTI